MYIQVPKVNVSVSTQSIDRLTKHPFRIPVRFQMKILSMNELLRTGLLFLNIDVKFSQACNFTAEEACS